MRNQKIEFLPHAFPGFFGSVPLFSEICRKIFRETQKFDEFGKSELRNFRLFSVKTTVFLKQNDFHRKGSEKSKVRDLGLISENFSIFWLRKHSKIKKEFIFEVNKKLFTRKNKRTSLFNNLKYILHREFYNDYANNENMIIRYVIIINDTSYIIKSHLIPKHEKQNHNNNNNIIHNIINFHCKKKISKIQILCNHYIHEKNFKFIDANFCN